MQFGSASKGRKVIKNGHVKVGGKVITIPTFIVKTDMLVEVHNESQIYFTNVKSISFTILYEDNDLLAFEKPAGWLTASPDPKKRTAFSVVKNWMLGREQGLKEVYFINKLPKDASGIVLIAKNSLTRKLLQDAWNKMPKRYYLLVQGQLKEDGVFGRKKKHDDEGLMVPYRLMNQGVGYAMVRFEMLKEQFSELLSFLESEELKVPGYARRGKADRSLGRLGLHFFSIDLVLRDGKPLKIKTQVPRDFLNLVKKNLIKP